MTSIDFPVEFVGALTSEAMNRKGTLNSKGEIVFQCPFPDHNDVNHPNARWNEAKATFYCDLCGKGGGALKLADLLGIQRPEKRGEGGSMIPPNNTATLQHSGCTLEEYAEAKMLPVDFLQSVCQLSEITYLGKKAVRIPYLKQDGAEGATRFRIQQTKSKPDNRFRWKKGTKPTLYGLHRLEDARQHGEITIAEGESDSQTLWYHGVDAIGLPGAGNWNEQRDAGLFDGFARINIIIEPDSGGDAVRKWLETSAIAERAFLIDLGELKDASNLHLSVGGDRAAFMEQWNAAHESATPWESIESAETQARIDGAWAACSELASEPRILDLVAEKIEQRGVAGESRNAKLLYLIVTSRVLPRPVSASVKGPSSAGKSFVTEQVLNMFPESAYYALSGMSERALVYDDEPLTHRYLVIYEAAGLTGDFASYLVRSLLSEGKIRYVTVEKTSEGMKPKTIERDGPTGLLVTTTAVHLHPENETRMLSIPATDSRDQTKRILMSIASPLREPEDYSVWKALQIWIDNAVHDVEIPFAMTLAEMIPPVAVRLRRDFGLILSLVRTHAILHQATRERDIHGRILASIDDYAVVHGLVEDLVSSGIESSVSATVRETVDVVKRLLGDQPKQSLLSRVRDDDASKTVSVTEIAKELNLDKSATSRRVKVAIDGGYLRNDEMKRGRPARIAIGEPLPEDTELLPSAERLKARCSVAGVSEGSTTPPPSNVVHLRAEATAELRATGTDDFATTFDLEEDEVLF